MGIYKSIKEIFKRIFLKINSSRKLDKEKIEQETERNVLARIESNPIILPRKENNWEAWQTFNPGAILIENKVHFLYRAIGEDGVSRLGYAVSDNGFCINKNVSCLAYEHNISKPSFNIYSFLSGGSFGGTEDPRIVRVNDENDLYMTYTAVNNGLGVALTSIKIRDFLNKNWKWSVPKLISKPGEVHKNWVIFPEKIKGKYAILHSISPRIMIDYRDTLEFKDGEFINSCYNGIINKKNGEQGWESWIRGAGAPPLKTQLGWLLFYHAIDENDPGKYKVGVMLLDLEDPTKILRKSFDPVLEPEKEYELSGFKPGIVYVSGAVIKDEKLLVYYGASDSYVAVAYADLKNFLANL